MVSLLSPRRPGRPGRPGSNVRLTATEPTEPVPDDKRTPAGPRYGWQLVAVAGGLATAAAGWVIVAGLSVVGWLAATRGEVTDALQVGTQFWLLANGTPAQLGSLRWSLVPLSLSLLIAFMISRFARATVRYAAPEPGVRSKVLFGTVGLCTVSYAAVVAAVGLSTGAEIAPGIVGAGLIGLVGSLWGSVRGLGVRVIHRLPQWARPVPYAVAAAVGVLLVAGLAVLVTAIALHIDRIQQLAEGLGAGAVGGIALWAAQAAFLPNLIVWCASYAVGAGFAIGRGSVVAPSDVTLGLLPSVPVLGAVPPTGPGPDQALAWLASGVAAGAVAALIVVRRRPAARFDETALVGGLAGLLAGLVFTGLAFLTGGDLGSGRLAGTGPRLLELLVMSGTLLGLSGLVCGLIFGLIVHLRRTAAERARIAAEKKDADRPAGSDGGEESDESERAEGRDPVLRPAQDPDEVEDGEDGEDGEGRDPVLRPAQDPDESEDTVVADRASRRGDTEAAADEAAG